MHTLRLDKLLKVWETAPIGMALLTEDGHWLAANPFLCQILQYSPHELVGEIPGTGRSFQDSTLMDDLVPDVEMTKAVVSGKVSHYTMFKRYVTKSQTIVGAMLHVWPYYEDGKFQCFVAHVVPVDRSIENSPTITRLVKEVEELKTMSPVSKMAETFSKYKKLIITVGAVIGTIIVEVIRSLGS